MLFSESGELLRNEARAIERLVCYPRKTRASRLRDGRFFFHLFSTGISHEIHGLRKVRLNLKDIVYQVSNYCIRRLVFLITRRRTEC